MDTQLFQCHWLFPIVEKSFKGHKISLKKVSWGKIINYPQKERKTSGSFKQTT